MPLSGDGRIVEANGTGLGLQQAVYHAENGAFAAAADANHAVEGARIYVEGQAVDDVKFLAHTVAKGHLHPVLGLSQGHTQGVTGNTMGLVHQEQIPGAVREGDLQGRLLGGSAAPAAVFQQLNTIRASAHQGHPLCQFLNRRQILGTIDLAAPMQVQQVVLLAYTKGIGGIAGLEQKCFFVFKILDRHSILSFGIL